MASDTGNMGNSKKYRGSFDPFLAINHHESFQEQADGVVQGTYVDDPCIRPWMVDGVVSAMSRNLSGGQLIAERFEFGDLETKIRPAARSRHQQYVGVTVFNNEMIVVTKGKAPCFERGHSIKYFRVGSTARIHMSCTTEAAKKWQKGKTIEPKNVYWDRRRRTLTSMRGINTIGPLPFKILDAHIGTSLIIRRSTKTGGYVWKEGSAVTAQI